MSEKNVAYLSLGSNIRPKENLPRSVELLRALGQLQAVSSAYETLPVGYRDQPNFFNAAVILETSLGGEALLLKLQEIETALERLKTENRDGPRTIDVDLSLFNREVREFGTKTVPHPNVLLFSHVAAPLAEVEPDYVHPLTQETLATIAERLDSSNIQRVDTCLLKEKS